MVFVEPGGLHDTALRHWVAAAADYDPSLPPKPARPQARKSR
jgi:hypothetical protein